jgi:Lon protease-like protein
LEDAASPLDSNKENHLIGTFEQCHEQLFGRPWARADQNQAASLAYRMASLLPLELQNKQVLLEMRSESDRREFVLQWLDAFLPKLIERRRARERAGGNGHAPK